MESAALLYLVFSKILKIGSSLISAAWPQIIRQSLHLIEILLILKGEKASSEMIKAALLLMPLGSSN